MPNKGASHVSNKVANMSYFARIEGPQTLRLYSTAQEAANSKSHGLEEGFDDKPVLEQEKHVQDFDVVTHLGFVGSLFVSSGGVIDALKEIDLTEAKASNPADRRGILNHIVHSWVKVQEQENPENIKLIIAGIKQELSHECDVDRQHVLNALLELDEHTGVIVKGSATEVDNANLKLNLYENELLKHYKSAFETLNRSVMEFSLKRFENQPTLALSKTDGLRRIPAEQRGITLAQLSTLARRVQREARGRGETAAWFQAVKITGLQGGPFKKKDKVTQGDSVGVIDHMDGSSAIVRVSSGSFVASREAGAVFIMEVDGGYPDEVEQVDSYSCVDLYDVVKHILEPINNRGMSYVEDDPEVLGPQPPQYFCVHARATKFKHWIAALRWHAEARRLPDTAAYFVCEFAESVTYEAFGDDNCTARDSEAIRAIESPYCEGVAVVLDEGNLFTRALVAGLVAHAFRLGRFVDFACNDGVLSTSVPLHGDFGDSMEMGSFDKVAAQQMLMTKCCDSVAANGLQQKRWKNFIIGGLEDETPATHPAFDLFDDRIAQCLWRTVLHDAIKKATLHGVDHLKETLKRHKFCLTTRRGILDLGIFRDTLVHFAAAIRVDEDTPTQRAGHGYGVPIPRLQSNVLDVLGMILDARPEDVNAQDCDGDTPLHYAAVAGNAATVKFLLARGAEPAQKNFHCECPLETAKLKAARHLGIDYDPVVQALEAGMPEKLYVTMVQATGLPHLNHLTADMMHCECEVKHAVKRQTIHRNETKCRTVGIIMAAGTDTVTWDEEQQLHPWHAGEPLEFIVYDKGTLNLKVVAKATLASDCFHNHDFEGKLPFEGQDGGLVVKVRVSRAQLGQSEMLPRISQLQP